MSDMTASEICALDYFFDRILSGKDLLCRKGSWFNLQTLGGFQLEPTEAKQQGMVDDPEWGQEVLISSQGMVIAKIVTKRTENRLWEVIYADYRNLDFIPFGEPKLLKKDQPRWEVRDSTDLRKEIRGWFQIPPARPGGGFINVWNYAK